MRTIVAVRGVANLGKSASIKKTYQLLKSAYPNAIFDEIVVSTDITIIIAINGVKIGIESQGDPNRRLFSSLNRFVQAGCKVIVCATRSRGKTVEAVNDLANQYQITWFDKQNEPNAHAQDAANDAMAKKIFKAVQSAINA